MLTLLLIVAVTGVTLAVFFYVGSMFLQGYIYTEPSPQLSWQAPAAGGAFVVFLALWCVLVANAEGASKTDIPYDTVFSFSPRVDLLKTPAKEIWAVKKNGEELPYKLQRRGQNTYQYLEVSPPHRPWRDDGVEKIKVVINGESLHFVRAPVTEGAYNHFVSDKGWVIKEYGDGPTGVPTVFRWGRFILVLVLNLAHFLLWWACLWLILRFQWSHALGLGVCLWLFFTLSMLPMLLGYAAEVAEKRVLS